MIKSPGFVLRKERHSNYLGWEMYTILRTQNFQSRMEILGFTWLVLEYSEGHFPHWTLLSRVTTASCPTECFSPHRALSHTVPVKDPTRTSPDPTKRTFICSGPSLYFQPHVAFSWAGSRKVLLPTLHVNGS